MQPEFFLDSSFIMQERQSFYNEKNSLLKFMFQKSLLNAAYHLFKDAYSL